MSCPSSRMFHLSLLKSLGHSNPPFAEEIVEGMLRPPQVVSHFNTLIAMTRVVIPTFPATLRKIGGEEGVGLAECNNFSEGAERAWTG